MFCAILVDLYYTKFIYILSKFYTVRYLITDETIIWLYMFFYKRNTCFILENLLNIVSFLSYFLANICTAIQQSCFYIDSSFIFNEISTLTQHWVIDIELTQFFQCCFNVVLSTSLNISRLNFHFQSNFNVEKRWWTLTVNVVSTLIQGWCVYWVEIDWQ